MFGHRRTELNEMITNWKKSPNLRPGSVKSPVLKEEEPDPEPPLNISPPLTNNHLFRSASSRSSRRLNFFRSNRHGIFSVNSNNKNNSNNVEEKPMKPVYINPNSDSVILNDKSKVNSPSLSPRINNTLSPRLSPRITNTLSPNLSPIPRERSPMFYSPRLGYRRDDFTEEEIKERQNRRRSRSFSGYTNVNRSDYYDPPPVPPVPVQLPKSPITPKRNKSLTSINRNRTPTREQHANSSLNSARKAVQKVQQNQQTQQTQQNQASSQNESNKLTIDPLPQPVSGQTTLKRTQSLKASLQRWGVEHKKSQSSLSNPPTPTTPTSKASIPATPQVPSINVESPALASDDGKGNALQRKLDHSQTNWAHAPVDNVLNITRQNSFSKQNLSRQNSLSKNLERQNSIGQKPSLLRSDSIKNARKINPKISNELLVNSLADNPLKMNEKEGIKRSSSLKNSIVENSTLIRKHSYRMSIYSDLDDKSSDASEIENSMVKNTIQEEEESVTEEEKGLSPGTPITNNESFYDENSKREESYYNDKSYYDEKDSQYYEEEDTNYYDDKSYKIVDDKSYGVDDKSYRIVEEEKPSSTNLYRERRRAPLPFDNYEQKNYLEENIYANTSIYPTEAEDNSYSSDEITEDTQRDIRKRDTVSTYPDDDGVEEVVYGTIKTIRSASSVSNAVSATTTTTNTIGNPVSTVSVSKEFPDITVLSNSDVGYDDISSVATPTLSTVNPSSIMTNQVSRTYNTKPDLSTLNEVSHENYSYERPDVRVEDEHSVYTTDHASDISSPICNPDSFLLGEKFEQDHYLPNIPPIDDGEGLKMKRSNSLTKVRKNILMRPREVFPRNASLRTLQQRRDEEMVVEKPEINNSFSIEREKKSVNESLDMLLVQLEKIKDDKQDDNTNTEFNIDNSMTQIDKQRLIISNLERKTPEPTWTGGEIVNGRVMIEKNPINTNSIHIETEETTMTDYTNESRYTPESEHIPRKESPLSIQEVTPKPSLEKLKKNDKNDSIEVKSFKSSISNDLKHSSSKNSLSKPVSVIQEREKKNIKGGLSPSLLSSSAWQYFNNKDKNEHRVIQPSQTPTSLGINTSMYKSPKLVQRNRSMNSSRIIPPTMSTIPISEANKISKSPSLAEHSQLRKVESIDNDIIKPPTAKASKNNSVDSNSGNSVKESKIRKFGKLVRNASLSARSTKSNKSAKNTTVKNAVTKPLFVISPTLPASKPKTEAASSPLIKEEKTISSPIVKEEKPVSSPLVKEEKGSLGRYRRRVPPEKEDKTKEQKAEDSLKIEVPSEKLSVDDTENSSHSLLPSFSFNETPLSIEIRNALVPETKKEKEDDATLDLFNALNSKNSQVVSPSSKYRSHRRSMPHPRAATVTKKTNSGEENNDSEDTEKQPIVLVTSTGVHKFNMVKQNKSRQNESVAKESVGDNNIGMENGVKLEQGRLEVTVGGKDQEMSELAEKLLLEGGESKSYKGYFDQASYIITPEKKKKKGEFLRNSLKIFKRKSSTKTPLISSPELISFSNNNGNIETYPLKPMKLGSESSNEEQNTLKNASSTQQKKAVHLTPIPRKGSVSNNTFLTHSPYSPTNSNHSCISEQSVELQEAYDNLSKSSKKKNHKIGRFWKK